MEWELLQTAVAGAAEALATPLSVVQITPEDRRLCVATFQWLCLFQTGGVFSETETSAMNDRTFCGAGLIMSGGGIPLRCAALSALAGHWVDQDDLGFRKCCRKYLQAGYAQARAHL